ncbi:MAG: prolyl oligopeptidase family serine peptidase [Nocardioides sp.]
MESVDPYIWLEDVTGEKALDWVRARNAATLEALPAEFEPLRTEILAVLDSDDRIPGVSQIGELFYNFWRDAEHPRGIWRRTTLESYRTDKPDWETVLDLDALNEAEDAAWVWHGASVLRPDLDRVLISLSPGGSDSDVDREFDLTTMSFVDPADGGFVRPESKGGLGWIDRDRVFVYTDRGPGTMTSSGYPRTVAIWRRGTPLAEAETVYEGLDTDMYIAAGHDDETGRCFVSRSLAFYNEEVYLLAGDHSLTKIDAPNSAEKSVHGDWLLLELREEYAGHPAGSLLATNFDTFTDGGRDFISLFEPTPTTSLAGYSWTKNHLLVSVLDDVKTRVRVLTPAATGPWASEPLVGAPAIGTVGVGAVDRRHDDRIWMTVTDFLHPTTLAIATLGAEPEVLKRNPAFFDADGLVAEQHFATSADGTRVPYFLVRPEALAMDGTAPTLLYGYGGFEISLTPSYLATAGNTWLRPTADWPGGVYVIANIRGGGEYGPGWHQAALKAQRHKAYEDFAAVARDLVARGFTSAEHLGCMGGSNGGLLTGNMLTRYPELFGAVVIQVPLLDMLRYTKLLAGASWIAEYGDPDTEDWEFIQTFSPYHLIDPDRVYPPVLMTTSTKDDRVHPGHARKMTAALLDQGHDVTYYENIEGGHGGAADNQQQATMSALAWTFLRSHLTSLRSHLAAAGQ